MSCTASVCCNLSGYCSSSGRGGVYGTVFGSLSVLPAGASNLAGCNMV